MEENTNLNVDTGADQVNTDVATDNNNITNENETVSMSKVDFEKAIQKATQSGEDRVRSEYSKKNKELEAKINELTPTPKTDAEIEIENQRIALEAKRAELEAKEKDVALRAALQEYNLDKAFAEYVKTDIDTKKLNKLIDDTVNARIKASGYVPTDHESNTSISKEQFSKLNYSEMEALLETNPSLANKFFNK